MRPCVAVGISGKLYSTGVGNTVYKSSLRLASCGSRMEEDGGWRMTGDIWLSWVGLIDWLGGALDSHCL